MRFTARNWILNFTLVALSSSRCLAVGSATPEYSIEDMGALSSNYSEGSCINKAGDVAGISFLQGQSGGPVGFANRCGTVSQLPFTGQNIYPRGMNDAGDIVVDQYPKVFLLSGTSILDINQMTPNRPVNFTAVRGINNWREMALYAYNPSTGRTTSYLWRDGVATDIGNLGGDAMAYGMNDNGEIVGYARAANGYYHAFLWRQGKMLDLGALSGNSNTYTLSSCVNNRGLVAGAAYGSVGWVPATWTRDTATGKWTQQLLAANQSGFSRKINSNGAVVGEMWSTSKAFVYTAAKGLRNLENLIPASSAWTGLSNAYDINEAGQITGGGRRSDGRYHAYRLTPISVP